MSPALSTPLRWRPADTVVTLLLLVGGLLSRLPFLDSFIDSHDATNYALALSNYDVGLHQPQPPGYPLYILLGQAALLFTGDPGLALVLVSAVMSGLAASAAYLTGRALWGRGAGAAAALLLVTSPFVWAQGTAPLPYAADLFFSLAAGWACHRAARSRELQAALIAGLALGLAVLLRQQNAFLLGGILLHAVWRKPPRFWLTALGAAGLLTTAALLLPPLLSSGGLDVYMEALLQMTPSPGGSLAPGGAIRASRLDRLLLLASGYLGGAVGLAGIPLAALGGILALKRLVTSRDTAPRLLLLWALPAWAFFLLIKQGSLATVLLITPPLFLVMGLAAAWIWSRGGLQRWLALALVLGLSLYQALVFCGDGPLPLSGPQLPFQAAAGDQDRQDLTLRLEHLRRLLPGDTIVVARAARLLSYHLPEWEIFTPPKVHESRPGIIREVVRHHQGKTTTMVEIGSAEMIHPGIRHLVLFDLPFKATRGEPLSVERVGTRAPLMKVVRLAPDARVTVHADGMDLEGSHR